MIQLELEMPLSKVLIEDNDDSSIKNSKGFVPIDYYTHTTSRCEFQDYREIFDQGASFINR